MDPPHIVPVKDLRPGVKNLTMILITLEIGKPSTTKDGHEVRSIRVADRTGCVNLSIWDEPGTLLQPGDIIRVHKAYASLFKNSLTLYIGKGGEIYKVGDFCLHFTETPNMSEENFSNPAAAPSGDGPAGGQSGGGGGRDRSASASEGKGGGRSGGGQGGGGGAERNPTYSSSASDSVNRIPLGPKHGGGGGGGKGNHHQGGGLGYQNGTKVHKK